jgi:hypothetical protein
MNLVTKQAAGGIGELYVFSELLKRGATPYVPLVSDGVDALVRTATGQIIELQIKSGGGAGGKTSDWFQVATVNPRKNFFIIGVEFDNSEPDNAWIFPSFVFDKYANRPPKGSPRDLDLDSGTRKYGMALRDLLCGFCNRWELIIHYEKYESLVESVEDLEDLLTMQEALESPEEDSVSIEEYERRRSATLSD